MTQIKDEKALLNEQVAAQREAMEAAAMNVCDRHHATAAALIRHINAMGWMDEYQAEVIKVGHEMNLSDPQLEQIVGPKGDWRGKTD